MSGNLQMMILVTEGGCPWDAEAFEKAAELGHLNIIEWGLEYGFTNILERVCSGAAKGGNAEIFSWALEKGSKYPSGVRGKLIRSGNHEAIETLAIMHNIKELDSTIVNCTKIVSGDLTVLDDLDMSTFEEFHIITIMSITTSKGRLDILQTLDINGFPLDFDFICEESARFGNLEMLKWSFSRTGEGIIGNKILKRAMESGNLDLCEWVIEQGGVWDAFTTQIAAYHGRLDVLKWAFEKGPPIDSSIYLVVLQSSLPSNLILEIMSWLHEVGVELPPAQEFILHACARDDLSTLAWILDKPGRWTTRENVIASAIKKLSFRKYQWLRNRFGDAEVNKVENQQDIVHGALNADDFPLLELLSREYSDFRRKTNRSSDDPRIRKLLPPFIF
eukprot:TRINITY_DN981_c0_g1_i1.p1 TRINITY_DN981_c0_g1~~TRINITY_DN981_c0_g1_i1.p1  ORF type:complete len:390 (+),score=68.54 TRINITY_DN981_c0_g1_i1:360-1529(+)